VITYLRSGKNCWEGAVERGEWDYVRETPLQTPRSVQKGEGGDAPGAGAEIFPCSPWWRPWWGRLSPFSPWRSTMEQTPTGSPWNAPCQTRCMPEGDSNPMRSPRWSRLLPGAAEPRRERSPHQIRFAGQTCEPIGEPHWSSLFLKDCRSWTGPDSRAGGCPKEAVTPWGAHYGAACCWRTASHRRDPRLGSLWRTAACGKIPLWKRL